MNSASKKVAVVTGVSKGYGRAVCEMLLEAGWAVVGDARDGAALSAVAKSSTTHEEFRAIQGDVLDESHLNEVVNAARTMGSISLLVNNASSLGPSPLPRLSQLKRDELEALFRVNVIAPLRLIQLAITDLMTIGGRVINVTSDVVPESYEGWGGYGASKAALEKITAVYAVETPSVRFYSLDPGDMRTDMHQAAFPGEDISDRPEPESSAPAVLRLATDDLPSGRYRSADLLD